MTTEHETMQDGQVKVAETQEEKDVARRKELAIKFGEGTISSTELAELDKLRSALVKTVANREAIAKREHDHAELMKTIHLGDKRQFSPQALASILLDRAKSLGYLNIQIFADNEGQAKVVLVEDHIKPVTGSTRSNAGKVEGLEEYGAKTDIWPKPPVGGQYDMQGMVGAYGNDEDKHIESSIGAMTGYSGKDDAGTKASWRNTQRRRLINRMREQGRLADNQFKFA